jgi:Protein of unknown function (DUF3822)
LKPSFHIKPASAPDPASSILLLIAGERQCSFAVMNYLSRELVEFGYYTTEGDEPGYVKFFDENELMNGRYYQTAIAYDVNESVQIPSAVYKYEDGQLHLDTVYGREVQQNIVSENLAAFNLYNVYRMPAKLQSTISRKFLSGKFWHFYTVVLKNVSSQQPQSMFIDFKRDEISIVILKENRLLLAQTFSYATPEDLLYNLLKCCQQLDLSQQQVKVFLSGLIEKDSAIYRQLYKYFINLEFETSSSELKLTEELKVHPEHYFSSISKLASCVL